jgi:hypothetical protein
MHELAQLESLCTSNSSSICFTNAVYACLYRVCANLQVKLEQAAVELSVTNQKVDALNSELAELQDTLEQVPCYALTSVHYIAPWCASENAVAQYCYCLAGH